MSPRWEFGKLHELADVFDEHLTVLSETLPAIQRDFYHLVFLAANVVRCGGKIILFGNGGSAADAQHIATELTVRFVKDRAPIAALSLATDTSALTAIGNDLGFDQIFSRQIEAIGQRGDLAIGISTSGKSPNVLMALRLARTRGLHVAGLTGGAGGEMPGLVSPLLIVPSTVTARIQEMHALIGHAFCGELEATLGLV